MTVPVGLKPVTVAWSAIAVPTVAEAGSWLVLMNAGVETTCSGSSATPLLMESLLLSPL